MEESICLCEGESIYRHCLHISIYGNELGVDYDGCACGAFEEEFKINYCPMCGRKLAE